VFSKDISDTKKRALRMLAKRNFSESEMSKRLIEKGETQEDAEETVRWLTQLGYIDDSNYAALIVNHYAKRGYGKARIKEELYKRGIARDMRDEKLALIDENEGEYAALELLRKKLKGSEDKDDLRRARDALVRRGFSYDDANSAISAYLSARSE